MTKVSSQCQTGLPESFKLKTWFVCVVMLNKVCLKHQFALGLCIYKTLFQNCLFYKPLSAFSHLQCTSILSFLTGEYKLTDNYKTEQAHIQSGVCSKSVTIYTSCVDFN